MGIIGYMVHVVFGTMLFAGNERVTQGLLYPRESETREVRSLDGMWHFAKSDTNKPSVGLREKWYLRELRESTNVINMPVPSRYFLIYTILFTIYYLPYKILIATTTLLRIVKFEIMLELSGMRGNFLFHNRGKVKEFG